MPKSEEDIGTSFSRSLLWQVLCSSSESDSQRRFQSKVRHYSYESEQSCQQIHRNLKQMVCMAGTVQQINLWDISMSVAHDGSPLEQCPKLLCFYTENLISIVNGKGQVR